jgi:hypothetical protein
MGYFKYSYSQRLDIHMKQKVVPLTHILVVISIIVLIFAIPAYAEETIADNSVETQYVEEIMDSATMERRPSEGLADESVTLFTGLLPFDAEPVILIAELCAVHEVNAATPLGRLAIAALEGYGFEYVISDELFESDGILTLVSIEDYVNDETGTWKAYEETYDVNRRIANDEVNTRLIADSVIFAYGNENERAIAFVEILAEPLVDLVDEIDAETLSEAEITPEPTTELDEQ